MPLLNGRGDVLSGGGGTQGYLNGQPIPFPTSGGGAWLTDALVLVQVQPANVLATWVPGESTYAVLPQNLGANGFAAGGGRYLAWLSGVGLCGSGTDSTAGFAGPLSVAPDGTLAYVPNAQIGTGLTLVTPDQPPIQIPGIVAYSEQTVSSGQAIWQGGAYGTTIPRPAA